jgi:alpha-amylase
MWANYRRGVGVAVPCPADGDQSVLWWYDKIASMAQHWAALGITDVLFPCPLKTSGGAGRSADGYMPFDDYDIGSKLTTQFGGKPTRFGDDGQLRRAIAICHANGLNALIDVVMHQRGGGHNGVYDYLGSDGKTLNGRFPKRPECFRGLPPRVPEDPVPDPADDYEFGDELCPVNARPKGFVWDGLCKSVDWLFRTLDADGGRLDDMKGMAVPFIKAVVTTGAMRGKWFMGEYASGNRHDTDWWVSQVDALCSALDFDFHYNMVKPMCNGAGSGQFHMGSLAGRGMIGTWPMKAVPFVESMDSDTDGFATIVDNKELGYALLLTGEGLPLIYARDFLQESDCYGLARPISNLVWIHQMLANGSTIPRLTDDPRIYAFERNGDPGLLVALSNDVWNPLWHTVTVQTAFGPHVQLHDYTGHNDADCWTDSAGSVTFGVPPAANGRGYGCWSRAGLNAAIEPTSRATTQVFFGADDLDIASAKNGTQRVGRVWVAKGSPLRCVVAADLAGWSAASSIDALVRGPDGVSRCSCRLIGGTPAIRHDGSAQHSGWHAVEMQSAGLPSSGTPFELAVRYTAPKELSV